MGVDVVLYKVEQRGTSPKGRRLVELAAVIDPEDEFSRFCQSSATPILSAIDPYGNRVFSKLDLDPLIEELEMLRPAASDQMRISQILALATRCAHSSDLEELHFQGD